MRKFSTHFAPKTISARLFTLIAVSALVTAATATGYMQVRKAEMDSKARNAASAAKLFVGAKASRPQPLIVGTCDTAGPIEVESTGGTAASVPTAYATLRTAFTAINDGAAHTGVITIDVCGDTTETASATLNASGAGAASYTSIAISPAGGAARTITGNLPFPLIDLNGADNVTINGVNAGGNSITISNTYVGDNATSTIRFIGGATNNIITNSSILGSFNGIVESVNGGVIFFSTDAVSGNGNDNNTISSCNLGPAGTNLPTMLIHGLGSTTTADIRNSGNVIDNNNLFDYFNATNSVSGIYIGNGNDAWTISNNKIYQTAARTFTNGFNHRYAGISINSTTDDNRGAFTITGNIIGFGAADGTGTTIISGTGNGGNNEFRGIDLISSSDITPTSIQGNIISGINQTTARNDTLLTKGAFTGIVVAAPVVVSSNSENHGRANIGDSVGNTIGSLDGSSTIVINGSATLENTAEVFGIADFSTNGNTISNNSIGSITIQGPGTALGVKGIYYNTAQGVTETVNNNTVANLTDTQAGPYETGGIQGVFGNLSATGNTVRNINAASTFENGTAVKGIAGNSSTGVNIISQNTVHSLFNNAGSTNNVSVTGIAVGVSASGNVVSRNSIHSLAMTSTGRGEQVIGLSASSTGTTTYQNNMIRLGIDAAGASITDPASIYGIRETNAIGGTTGAPNNYYHNSVYIGGSGVLATTTTGTSYAFYSGVGSSNGTRNVMDNIFYNARSNATAGNQLHYGILIASTTGGLASNYNDLYATGTDGALGYYNGHPYYTLQDYQAASGQEANSINADPQYSNPIGNSANVNLHVLSNSPVSSVGTFIASVLDDFDGQTRNNPPDIGADEINGDIFQFSNATYLVNEAAGTVTITVTRSGDATATTSINYATSDGTATAGNDYTNTSGALNFAALQTSNSFTIPIINDTLYEGAIAETFSVTLSGATTGTPNTATVSIVDDDSLPTISIGNASASEADGMIVFTVTQSAASGFNTTFKYSTANGTATAGSDYTPATNETGTITAGNTTTTISIPVLQDTVYEGSETFTVTISTPTNATIVTAAGTGTITDDEAQPVTLVVNTDDDVDNGNGCLASHCSLREAINAANSNADTSTISFNIPGTGVHTIAPTTPLPDITQPVIIDGYTQPGSSVNTLAVGNDAVLLIEINGGNQSSDLFHFFAGNNVIRGLVINRAPFDGIFLGNPNGIPTTGNIVEGNFIGTDPTGTIARANNRFGVSLYFYPSANNLIGGTTPASRNLISGNGQGGVVIGSAGSSNNVVTGNYIGTTVSGSAALSNNVRGVFVGDGATNNLIGGTTSADRNVISGNGGTGVELNGNNLTNNDVRGNYIGIANDGVTALGNFGYGVNVGGTATGNTVLSNLIFANQDLGINLGGGGVTPNDTNDTDTGANDLQNFPVISSAVRNGGDVTIDGSLNSIPSTNGFTIQFFTTPTCDASGNGEGKRYIGAITVDTGAAGNNSFSATLTTPTVAGEAITATATDPAGNTSEFSQCRIINNTPQPFVVTNTADTGAGSLRQAITDANANNLATDTISFNIAGTGVQTISPANALPDITDPVIIDGYTQPGSSVNTTATTDNAVILIELDGTNVPADDNANGLRLVASGSGSTVRGLAINRFARVGISLNGADNNTISGNFIGTDPTGLIDLGNNSGGVRGEFGSNPDNNLIGGTAPAARNIISGNGNAGGYASIEFDFASGNVIQGNFIGLGSDGATAIGNSGTGVVAGAFTGGTRIGGDDADDGTTDGIVGARNYISGNGGTGISIGGAAFGGVTIKGNFIGTDTTGTQARGNNGGGISTNVAGNSIIGGTTAGAGNLVSGNTGNGISIGFTGGLIVKGNRIGTRLGGVTALGNTGNGVEIAAGGGGNIIGGAGVREDNIIAFNGQNGVQITDVGVTPTNNPIQGNSIFSNGGLGINLTIDGVTPNDSQDGDSGANNLQNFPVITAATVNGSVNTINGTLNSTPGQTFTIDFYRNEACDPSGYGEGKVHLGSVTTGTTDGNGDVAFTYNPATLTAGEFVTATATDANGNTSEFSACATIAAPRMGALQFSASNYNDNETNTTHDATITVTRTGGTDGAVSVHYATSDGTATAGSDYTATSGDLNWADGDATNKTFSISVTGDTNFESDETVNLTLSNPTGGATLSTPSAATLTIVGDDGAPTISINDVTFTGVDSIAGKTAVGSPSGFTVTLNTASGQTVTVHYATADGTATAGEDYVETMGTLTFAPGETSKPILVSIVPDTRNEPTETFFVNLDTPTGATIADSQGVGTIPNDDPQPSIAITDVLIAEPVTGTSTANFTVNLSAASGQTVTVQYATANGTATAPADYTAIPDTTLAFAPGETTKTVSVTISGDDVAEGNETLFVNLSTAINATISDNQGQGTITDAVLAGQIIISEFRLRGALGVNDEFVELFNTTAAPITVATSDGSAGWTLAASDGVARFIVPSGTIIPARGHYLGANNNAAGGYSLGLYPAGVGTTATPNATYTLDIPDNSGIALFKTTLQVGFTQANALDAVGFTGTVAPYSEGTLLTSPGANDGESSFVRKPVLASQVGQLTDSNDNATDFVFVSTTGTSIGGVQSTLGAPGPENLSSPLTKSNTQVTPSLIAPMNASSASPNRVRDNRAAVQTPNSLAGTISIQRRFTNPAGSGVTITRLRLRVIDITTLGSPGSGAGQADLRVLSSTGAVTDSSGNTVVTVMGTTLETPPAQADGGGLNSTLTGTLPGGALPPGSSVDVQMKLGVNQAGSFRFFISQEALP